MSASEIAKLWKLFAILYNLQDTQIFSIKLSGVSYPCD